MFYNKKSDKLKAIISSYPFENEIYLSIVLLETINNELNPIRFNRYKMEFGLLVLQFYSKTPLYSGISLVCCLASRPCIRGFSKLNSMRDFWAFGVFLQLVVSTVTLVIRHSYEMPLTYTDENRPTISLPDWDVQGVQGT